MATTTPAQNFPVPENTDDPDIPGDMMALALAIERRVLGVYQSAGDRNDKLTSPQTGQFAYLIDTNDLTLYNGTAWVSFPEQEAPTTHAGTTPPSNSLGTDGDTYFQV